MSEDKDRIKDQGVSLINYIKMGLRGRTLKATFLLYLFGVAVLGSFIIIAMLVIQLFIQDKLLARNINQIQNNNRPVVINQTIRITAPPDNATAPDRTIVEGTVSDPKAIVWIILHPTEIGEHFVQPEAIVSENGKWIVEVYIGQPGITDVGKQFEILAVANPTMPLKEGDRLSTWPEAELRSQIIRVTRK